VESLGILPTTKLQVADVPEKSFSENSADSLDDLLDRALSQRPDLVGKLANLRAKQAGVRKARAAYYPKVSLGANAGWAEMDVSVKDSRYFGGNEPVYGAGVAIELPIFDGFARRKQLRITESELRAAEDELAHSRDSVIREVWKARTDFETALRKQDSATKLVAAAESAFAASLDAYQHGLGTYVDVANAQRNVTASRSVVADTRSAIYTSARRPRQASLRLRIPPKMTAHSPTLDVLGSYFPAWMVCIILGLVLTVVARQLLIGLKLNSHLRPVGLVYFCMMILWTMAVWLICFKT
jgi:outer membrane protein TolC